MFGSSQKSAEQKPLKDANFLTDLDKLSKMITFGLILSTFESSIIFGGSWGSIENWLKPKIEPSSENLACPNP